MRHALYFPPVGELSDPRTLIELGTAAEEYGWDGLFLWDHILRPEGEPQEIADVWVALSGVATVTARIRIGPMVTPTVRRRPQKLAREAATLDRLSKGRVTLGLGLGVDSSGELSRFGEITDAVERGDALDEAADLVVALWSGERIDHHGAFYEANDVQFLPTPVQRPRIPMWFAASRQATRPVRRAARFDGLFAIEIDLDGLRRMVRIIDDERGNHEDFDIAVLAIPGSDLPAWEDNGSTWAMWSFLPGATALDIFGCIRRGPTMEGPA